MTEHNRLFQSKDYYRNIAKNLPNNWQWIGGGDLPYTHSFTRRIEGKFGWDYKFEVIECSEYCLTNGDLEFMVEHGMTCDKDRLKKLSKRFQKQVENNKMVAKQE